MCIHKKEVLLVCLRTVIALLGIGQELRTNRMSLCSTSGLNIDLLCLLFAFFYCLTECLQEASQVSVCTGSFIFYL